MYYCWYWYLYGHTTEATAQNNVNVHVLEIWRHTAPILQCHIQQEHNRWTKGCILLFHKQGDLRIAKNNRVITLTFILAKIYNVQIINLIEPEIEKILSKKQNGFRRNRSTSQILVIRRILDGVHAKNLETTPLFVDFSKVFDTINRGKSEQILLAYGLSKEPVAALMMPYKNTEVKVRSLNGNTNFFDIVAGVLKGDTLATCLLSA